jgi:thiol-disulfide isomerase/thioredoxin
MDLQEYYEIGLAPEAYTDLLDEKQRELHALYQRRTEIDPETIDRLRAAGPFHVLVITEPWCGDSLAIFPAIAELCRQADIVLRVVRRDEHPELIDKYLTNGGRAIPIAVGLDADFAELFRWGPRPAAAQAIFETHRAEVAAGTIAKTEVYKRIRAFYAQDKGQAVVRGLLAAFGVS